MHIGLDEVLLITLTNKYLLKIFIIIIITPIGVSNLVKADDQPFVLKWSYTTGCDVYNVHPLAVDVTGDGVMEVFVSGRIPSASDKAFCFYGDTGIVKWSADLQFSLGGHNPMEIYDLDNDGNFELIQPSPNGLEVLNAEDGSVYWRNSDIKCSEAHQLVLDTDQNGYPYIYTCNADASYPYDARLRKVDGRTGDVLISKSIWYPCHGGLSAADVEGDGDFEIFMTDRSTGNGKGIQCYDAETLDLIWYRDNIYCSSHLPVIVDVNDDEVLDVIVSRQRTSNAGIYCFDGRNGNYIPGKYQNYISGLASHESFAVYDVDGDGNLEIATCAYSDVKIFDIGDWGIEATLVYDGKPPYFANVMGDGDLEIILSEEMSTIRVFDNQYQQIGSISGVNSRGSIVQDVDDDGLNELVMISVGGTVRVYDTLAVASYPLPRTNTHHYSERNARAGVYIPPPGVSSVNYLPTITNPNPVNGSSGVSVGTNWALFWYCNITIL